MCWKPVKGVSAVQKKLSKGTRVIIVHAGGCEGFVPNASLVYKANYTSGDYHDNMNLDNYKKWLTTQLLPNLPAKPPQLGEPSYELWLQEKTAVLSSLNKRARMIVDDFNSMPGFSYNVVQGAMYAFPRIELPAKAIEVAKTHGKAPDVFYAFKLLEETGICVVPGSGFGQKPGTFHFRTTILPQPELLHQMLDIFRDFQVHCRVRLGTINLPSLQPH
ncbi:unnamed protein product [Parnassius apollo]|uniref:(apollo) hypothetical protein n=1 Tax=Parnassius apollo TaxID=110799 RepID=A0A8S3W7Z6_PARAO|nr:unnamed protein product [Parnassius apollo]